MANGTIEILPGDAQRPYRVLGEVKASKGARFIWSKAPEISAGEEALRQKAAKLGADAVINASFERGISMMSWKAVKGQGTAIAYEDAGTPAA